MDTAQTVAFLAPCTEAEDTLDPRFYRLRWGKGGRTISIGLTLNVGLE
jgi:hypothetical protein